MSKMGKKLIKGLKDIKEGKTTLLCDSKYWYLDGVAYDSIEKWLKAVENKRKIERKKMTPEQKKKEKERLAKEKLKDKKREEKWANQRKKKGYSDCDLWNVDLWFLDIFPKMLDELIEIRHGWQPRLGYKIENKKLVKTKEDITPKQEKEVLKYLSNGFKMLNVYQNMEDLDYKQNYIRKFYKERAKKIEALHKQTFDLFRDIFYNLWD